MMSKPKLDEPLNPTERYLHGINVRLDELTELVRQALTPQPEPRKAPTQRKRTQRSETK